MREDSVLWVASGLRMGFLFRSGLLNLSSPGCVPVCVSVLTHTRIIPVSYHIIASSRAGLHGAWVKLFLLLFKMDLKGRIAWGVRHRI